MHHVHNDQLAASARKPFTEQEWALFPNATPFAACGTCYTVDLGWVLVVLEAKGAHAYTENGHVETYRANGACGTAWRTVAQARGAALVVLVRARNAEAGAA